MSVLVASFDKSNHWKKCADQFEVRFPVLFPLLWISLTGRSVIHCTCEWWSSRFSLLLHWFYYQPVLVWDNREEMCSVVYKCITTWHRRTLTWHSSRDTTNQSQCSDGTWNIWTLPGTLIIAWDRNMSTYASMILPRSSAIKQLPVTTTPGF